MLCAEITAAIEKMAPLWAQADWDKSGIQVASSRHSASKLAVSLDATTAVVEQALDMGAEYIFTHHPLSLSPDLPRKLDNYHRVLQLLFNANVPLYAAHTSLDVNLAGPAGWLGRALDLRGKTILEVTHKDCHGYGNLGFGEIGDLPGDASGPDVIKQVMSLLKLKYAHICGPAAPCGHVRLAYCGGSGGSLLHMAEKSGANLFITGDIKYHVAMDTRLTIVDVGHYSLESVMMEHMASYLRETLTDVEVVFLPSGDPFGVIKI